MNINFQKSLTFMAYNDIIVLTDTTYPKFQTKRIDEKMTTKFDGQTIATTDWTNPRNSYLTYKRMFDIENGTTYGKQHYEMYIKHNNETHENDTQTTETHTKHIERIEYNNGTQRNIIGNLNDNEIVITKCFNHLNAMKRSMSLSQQSDDDYTKLFHENIMFRELLALELSMRKLQNNIKK